MFCWQIYFNVKLRKPWTPECNVIVLQGQQRGNKTTKRNSNQFVVLRFACMSWTFLWLVTKQSTILQYFRHSQFSEFSCKYFLRCVVSENIHTSSKDGSSVYIFPTLPPGISSFASYFRLQVWLLRPPSPQIFQWPSLGGYVYFLESHHLFIVTWCKDHTACTCI